MRCCLSEPAALGDAPQQPSHGDQDPDALVVATLGAARDTLSGGWALYIMTSRGRLGGLRYLRAVALTDRPAARRAEVYHTVRRRHGAAARRVRR